MRLTRNPTFLNVWGWLAGCVTAVVDTVAGVITSLSVLNDLRWVTRVCKRPKTAVVAPTGNLAITVNPRYLAAAATGSISKATEAFTNLSFPEVLSLPEWRC